MSSQFNTPQITLGPTPDSSLFPHIRGADIDRQVLDTKKEPWLIHQQGANVCVPAAFWYVVAKQRPDEYERLIRQIYTTGSATLGGLRLAPSEAARQYKPRPFGSGHLTLRAVDWIAFSALKPSYSDPHALYEPLVGMTLPNTVAGWLKEAGCAWVSRSYGLGGLLPQTMDHLMRAQKAQEKGHSVILIVDAEVFQEAVYRDGKINPNKERMPGPGEFQAARSMPNHVVVLASNINVKLIDDHPSGPMPASRRLTAALAHRVAEEYERAQWVEPVHADRSGRQRVAAEGPSIIELEAFTWGNIKSVQPRMGSGPGGRVRLAASLYYFLRHYYGYVGAKWKE